MSSVAISSTSVSAMPLSILMEKDDYQLHSIYESDKWFILSNVSYEKPWLMLFGRVAGYNSLKKNLLYVPRLIISISLAPVIFDTISKLTGSSKMIMRPKVGRFFLLVASNPKLIVYQEERTMLSPVIYYFLMMIRDKKIFSYVVGQILISIVFFLIRLSVIVHKSFRTWWFIISKNTEWLWSWR